MLKNKIAAIAKENLQTFIEVRHHLHKNPELSFCENQTSLFIQQQLSSFGIPFTILGGTGVIGLIEGKDPQSRCIALRADMDALPISEENEIPYKSQNAGVMHACGHDVHTTCLLGAAKILQLLKDEWTGTIKLIFQPGEEKHPGGASLLIKDGVLKNPAPQGIIGLHVHPGLDVGKISFRKGMVMASADEIYITITGSGGHAAAPHLTTDIVLVTAQIIVALQQVVSRNANPFSPSVLSICAVNGGTATNIIPREIKLMGTFRAMDEEWRAKAHLLIKKMTVEIANSMGASAEINILKGYPTVKNDPAFTGSLWKLADEFQGKENVSETELRMGAEDFGFYSQEIPGCFFRLGVRNEARNIIHNVHTPKFNIDESAIETGMGIMAWLGSKASIEF